ncbi:MAG TPA: translation initiation factor IF-2 [Candidatus Paceibacterota bacterium]|nr:translation initiation factor IF-2 [Candidatus Paceibacterota bacterium]
MITQNAENRIAKEHTGARAPVVVVLGHVDHGKSSLLEAIREDFRITAKESGGITQHMGAYQAQYQGKNITFIDTPGHELFSAMRSRGAKVADIAVLVVAADESVKPQTVEAIEQVKKAGIPMVVAINKIDKLQANSQRVKQELAQHEVIVESYGGNVPSVETSATTKQGISELLEMLLLVADLESLKANPEQPAEGVVIESSLDPKRGPLASLLVLNGTLRLGDWLSTPSSSGKARMIEDFQRQQIAEAGPATPAVVLGFLIPPRVGDVFRAFESETAVQEFVWENELKEVAKGASEVNPEAKLYNIILKADVAGSLEALEDVLHNLPQGEVQLRLVEAGVGEITENDVKLARSTTAVVFGFRTKVSVQAADLAEKEQISIETFQIIYELIQRVREAMEQSLKDEGGRQELGTLNVLAIFLVDKTRQVIGGKVVEGEVRKGVRAEIIRAGEVVGQGKVTNVQHDKKDVPSVAKGKECGLSFEAAEKVQAGDQLQFFVVRAPKK